MEIEISRDAQKALQGMQPKKAKQIRAAIGRVAEEPAAPNNNLTPLKGLQNGFRIRIGEWRVSYTLDRDRALMSVFEIAPRGGAYR